VRRLVLGFVLGVTSTVAALSYAGGSSGQKCLGSISPIEGYRYFSGNENSLHNHPAMYASGSGNDAKLTVLGVGVDKAFPAAEPEAAFAAYRELLVARGYLPAPPP
jgi:hypothetical protein